MKKGLLASAATLFMLLALVGISGCGKNQVTVSFETTGGSTIALIETKVNSTIIEPVAPIKKGSTFKYWCSENKENCTKFDFTTVIKVNTTLYAKWEKDTYTLTLDQQNGSGGTDAVFVHYNAPMPTATAPTRGDGFIFTGYYDALEGGIKYYHADMTGAKDWDKAGAATLYARWGKAYTVTQIIMAELAGVLR